MSKTNTAEFNSSIARIYLFFAALVKWFRSLLDIASPQKIVNEETTTAKQISPKDAYVERNKSNFLQTFQVNNADWNANIEPEIKDAPKLAEILADPNNYLEKKWRTRVLIENTPRGNVIMFYDIYKRAFSYYSDNAVMPYDIMNAVAMKYVVTFWCRDFFVDSNILPKPTEKKVSFQETREVDASTTTIPSKLQKGMITQENNKQAFAKFKSYNTATKRVGVSQEEDKIINCFLHLGGVRNWTPILKKAKANPINGFQTDMVPGASNKKLSYLEYKKRQSSSQ